MARRSLVLSASDGDGAPRGAAASRPADRGADAPRPSARDEAARCAAVEILRAGTMEDDALQAVLRTAGRLFGTAVPAISLVGAQRSWLRTPGTTELPELPRELPRAASCCDHAIRDDGVLAVEDITRDPRFSGLAELVGAGVRFYAGVPLALAPGLRVGALCLFDTRPRSLSQDETAALSDLAAIVAAQLRGWLDDAQRVGARRPDAPAPARGRSAGEPARRPGETERSVPRARDDARETGRQCGERSGPDADWHADRGAGSSDTEVGHWYYSLREGRTIWSDATYRIAGVAPSTRPWAIDDVRAACHPEDRERVARTLRAAVEEGAGGAFGSRLVRADGSVREIATRIVCEIDASGAVVGLFGTVVDVAGRARAEAARASGEARYRGLAEALPMMIWATRAADGVAIFVNACFHDYYGPIGPERAARTSRNHPDDSERMETAWREAAAAGAAYSLEARLRRSDGRHRWHKLVMIPIFQGGDARPVEWLGTALDIDDIVTAQRQLDETQDLLRIAQEAAQSGAWNWDMRTGLATLDPESVRLYGLPGEESVVLPAAAWTALIHADDRIPTWDAIRHAVETRQPYIAEYRIPGPKGDRWMHVRGRAIFGEDDRPYRMVGLHFDVTERRAAEMALKDATDAAETARRDAELASAAKTEFLAAMSHEIRTPLNGILGYADLLLEEPHHRPEDRRRLELIQGSGAALLTVVNDILDYSKIEAGQLDLDPIAFPLRGLVDDTVAIVRGGALKSPLAITCTIDPGVPAHAFGDANRLRQVLLNLLNNAVKFTPQGSVTLSVRPVGCSLDRGASRAADVMRFEVTDTGIGIPAEQHGRLFRRFSQVDGSISRRFGGTGLGLAICHRLVTLMGGEIDVESVEGEGSTFWFTLALPEQAAPAVPAETEPRAAVPATPELDAPFPRLLLVEDVPINQELCRAVLESGGYRVAVANDGAESIAAIEAAAAGGDPYRLVLMDVQMPGMDGLTATRLIRALAAPLRDVPIVAMTANVLPEQIRDIRAAGMDDHVGKPFKRAALFAVIERWCAVAAPGADTASGGSGPESTPARTAAATVAPAILDSGTFAAVRDTMGSERVRALLTLLENELQGRFAFGAAPGTPARLGVDRAQLATDAHAMVSAAGVLGFVGLSHLCREIEAACHGGRELGALVDRLAVLRTDTLGAIRSLRAA